MRIVALNGLLGYGYPAESLERAFSPTPPDVVGVDAGSTDPGPHYLGHGTSFTNRAAVKRDLALALPLALRHRAPLVIGSAGGAGGNVHVDWLCEIVGELAREQHLSFRMAVIRTEVSREYVHAKRRAGRLRALGPHVPTTAEAIDESVRIVSQVGVEPFLRALETGADVILAGRACDTAIFAAPAIRAGFEPGPAFHMGKILECGCLAAAPQSAADVLTAVMEPGGFVVEPASPTRRCTVEKVAAHSLYEQASPHGFYEPGGRVDLEQACYEQVTDRAVRVTGSRFVPASVKTLKLEGARRAGFRTLSVAGINDPRTVQRLDFIEADVRQFVEATRPPGIAADRYRLALRLFGGAPAPGAPRPGHAAGLVLEVVAESQAMADTLCALARSRLLHVDYPGRQATAGNVAFLYSPSDLSAGPVYTFSLYHLAEADDLEETASLEVLGVGGRS